MTNKDKEALLFYIVEANKSWNPDQVEDFFQKIVALRSEKDNKPVTR